MAARRGCCGPMSRSSTAPPWRRPAACIVQLAPRAARTDVRADKRVPQNPPTPLPDSGTATAMPNLAVLHGEGFEAKPNFQSAAKWFRKAGDRGVADSQYNLGILYARGIGVEQNLAESFKWFTLAAQQGDKDSIKK